jgi:hypothetical protein
MRYFCIILFLMINLVQAEEESCFSFDSMEKGKSYSGFSLGEKISLKKEVNRFIGKIDLNDAYKCEAIYPISYSQTNVNLTEDEERILTILSHGENVLRFSLSTKNNEVVTFKCSGAGPSQLMNSFFEEYKVNLKSQCPKSEKASPNNQTYEEADLRRGGTIGG